MGRLIRGVENNGVLTNTKGESKRAYIKWERDSADQGFILRDRNTNKPLRSERFKTLKDMILANVNFVLDTAQELAPVA